MNNPLVGPPGQAATCRPQINTATKTNFELVNPLKDSNFIVGEVLNGELTFVVENKPKTPPKTGCPGWWMFAQMMEHFQLVGTAVTAIIGSWTYADNLAAVNGMTAGTAGISLEEAAKRAVTGGYAAAFQYTAAAVVSATGTPGNYTQVKVRFTQ